MIPFIYNIQNRLIHRNRQKIGGCQKEEKIGRNCLMSTGFSFGMIKNVLELNKSGGCTAL